MIDSSLDPVWEALERNPYGFNSIESDHFNARYVVTKPFKGIPALIWVFVIRKDGTCIEVELDHVEEFEGY